MFYASYGSYIHDLIRRYYAGELTKEQLPTAFMLGFSSGVEGERPAESTVMKYILSGQEYFKNFKPFPYRTLGTEKELHFELDGITFVAFLDYFGEENGNFVILDHKSRELKPKSGRKKPTAKDLELDSVFRQLYLYAHGVRQVFGEFPSKLCLNCFRNGNFIEEPFSERGYNDAMDWAKRKIEEIADETDFRPYVDYFQCRYLCGFHHDCCFWRGV